MEVLIVTPEEASKMLKTSKKTILDLLERGELPGYRLGSHWKIPLRLLKSYIESKALEETKERRRFHEEVQVEQEEMF